MPVEVGCCGFAVARERYFRELGLVEVQQTFYQPPRPSTAERWRKEAPEGFVFTLKAWQLITHHATSPTYRRLRRPVDPDKRDRYGFFRPTEEVLEAWKATVEVAEALEAEAIVFQCPARFSPTAEHKDFMRQFFSSIQPGPFLLVFEPRGSWQRKETEEICRELGLIACLDPFEAAPGQGPTVYWRLHGRGGYRYRYTDEDLAFLKENLPSEARSLVLFNNVSMWEDALRFKALLGS